MATVAGERLFGKAIKRREDPRFITGRGQYVDDVKLPGMTYAAFVRSQHAHAKIRRIDASAALKHPGVVAVVTGKDMAGVNSLPCGWDLRKEKNIPGVVQDLAMVPHMPLTADVARHVGDPVAVVIAESQAAAVDAVDRVKVDWEPLPSVTATDKAARAGAPQIHTSAPGNVAFKWEIGDRSATDAAFKGAAVAVKKRILNQRLVANAMEPRACIARFDTATGELTLWVTSQNPHVHRLLMCAFVLGIPEHKVRVIAPDVGGGFGSKIFLYNEEVVCSWVARQLKRPVRWTATRREAYLTDAHGRDHVTDAELALGRDGKILGLRVKTTANLGAYLSTFAPAIPTFLYGTLLNGVYTIGAIHCEVTGVFTNTTAVDAYRGAGRPEACYVLERIVEAGARALGMDVAELRKKNFIPKFSGAFQTLVAVSYDSGDYAAAFDRLLQMLNYRKFRAEQEAARKQGRLLGIGFSTYIEASANDIEYVNGQFQVKGVPSKAVPFGAVSLTAYVPHKYPDNLEPGLEETSFYDPSNFCFPFGAHACVVEVDRDTGAVKIQRYLAVDDVGKVINPMIVDGMVHGGIAQGVGQALCEGAVYDEGSGQLVTGSMMDYALPKADMLPLYETDRTVTPTPVNPMGIKGAGETGTIAATPTVVNAVLDAPAPPRLDHIEAMPLTSERVWKAIQAAKAKR